MLAAPVIASIYLATLLAVPGARKYLVSLGALLLVGMVGVRFLVPPGASSTPPSTTGPISADALQPIDIGSGDTGPIAEATSGRSAGPTGLSASNTASSRPSGEPPRRQPTAIPDVPPISAARTAHGSSAASVRNPTTARIAGSKVTGNRIRLTSAITLRFDRPVTLKQVRAAFSVQPAVKGTISALTDRVYAFMPSAPLAADTAYTIRLIKTIRDADGVAVAAPRPVRLLTASAPAIARFRPTKGTAAVDPTQLVSVRFTKAMNRRTTAASFAVVVGGRKVPGTVTWAEGDTVLVFRPARVLAKGSGVGVRVLQTATSVDGVALKKGGSITFTVVGAPKPVPTSVKRTPKPVARSGGAPTNGTPSHAFGGASGLEGIDVSHHDGVINWGRVASSGKTFAYIKASEGTDFVDPMWVTNRARAERAGLRVGAFHYANPNASAGEAAAEADHFVDTAAFRSGELLPMLDLEVTNGLSPNELQAWVASFLDRVYQRTGLRAGIYVSPSFWQTYLNDSSSAALKRSAALWIADWTTAPSPWLPASSWGGLGWTIWQYSDKARVPGMSKPADVDHLSRSAFARLVIR